MTILNPLSQKIFATRESSPGTLVFPTSSSDSIIGAGYVSANRSVSYTDSPEIRESLNLRDQVKDKDAAGEWSLPILVRPAGFTGSDSTKRIVAPMGDVLFERLIGRDQFEETGTLNEGGGIIASSSLASFTVDGLTYIPKAPFLCVIDDETIHIEHISAVVADSADGTLWQAEFWIGERGYGGTTPAPHTDGDTVTISSHSYSQETNRDSFTLWYQRDTVIYFAGGCTVSNMSFTGENKGYPMFELNGGFMTLGWAGVTTLNAAHTSGDTTIAVAAGHAKYFSIGARIYNSSDNDYESGTGNFYVVTAIDYGTDILTLDTGISANWSDGITIAGYLPAITNIGSSLKSEDTLISIGDSATPPVLTAKTPTGLSLAFDSPIKYIEEEITPNAISEYTEERRSISGTITQLMSIAELANFRIADQDTKQAILIRLGADTDGSKCMLYARRCTLQVPTENVSEPLVEQNMDYAVIDDDSEDSFCISFI